MPARPTLDLVDERTPVEDVAPSKMVGSSLVVRLRAQDPLAWEELSRLVIPPILAGIGVLYLSLRNNLQDIGQEVLLRLFNNLDGIEGDAHLGPWLSTVARNVAIDHLRRQCARPEVLKNGVNLAVSGSDAPDTRLEGDERIAAVRRCLTKLDLPLRAVVVLKHLEGLTIEAIAERLGIKPGTVGSRDSTARKKLAFCLNQTGVITGDLHIRTYTRSQVVTQKGPPNDPR